jgi:hypothetical protein
MRRSRAFLFCMPERHGGFSGGGGAGFSTASRRSSFVWVHIDPYW